ncbi:FecCD family ABC transporter permease [Oceanobacillus sojae]|uniref:FecCD family ABC transporter permease n=1 Tax=Oceanobacillus sojae TaxID=582851 RepID=UPI0009885274|nr:iron ABC transporter permease [Oceanobacillus sojae]MCT1903697.1 iron ABC transporter permease [Oceanobacillus sojae]
MELKNKIPFHFSIIFTIACIILVITFWISIVYGSADINTSTILNAVFNYDPEDVNHNIIIDVRIPRDIGALLVGVALAVSGAGIQSVTRNSLADPSLIGLNSGAALMLALTYAVSPVITFPLLILTGFIGAMLGGTMVLMIGRSRKDGFNPVRLILAGAAVSALLSAASQAIALYFRLNQSLIFWSSGGVSGTTWQQLYTGIPVVAIIVVIFILISGQLSILNLGESIAKGLGQNVKLIRAGTMLLSMLLAGISVAIVGQIAFVGLMVPHISRFLVGTDYKKVIPLTAVLGGCLVVSADTVARLMGEAPVSAIISFIGVPYFLYLIKKGGRTI